MNMKIALIIAALLSFPCLDLFSQEKQKPPYNMGISGSLNFSGTESSYHGGMNATGSFGRTVVPEIKLGSIATSLEAGMSLSMRVMADQRWQYMFIPFYELRGTEIWPAWLKSVTLTSSVTGAVNGYLRWNLFTQGNFVPFIAVMGGVNLSRSDSLNETLRDYGYEWNEESAGAIASDSTSSGGTSGSLGVQFGANYFVTSNISLNFQYDVNMPVSDAPGVSSLSYGLQYWF